MRNEIKIPVIRSFSPQDSLRITAPFLIWVIGLCTELMILGFYEENVRSFMAPAILITLLMGLPLFCLMIYQAVKMQGKNGLVQTVFYLEKGTLYFITADEKTVSAYLENDKTAKELRVFWLKETSTEDVLDAVLYGTVRGKSIKKLTDYLMKNSYSI